MSLKVTSPEAGTILNINHLVEFQGTADSSITNVSIYTPFAHNDYPLGNARIDAGRWSFSYQFNTSGIRTVIFVGLDSSNTALAIAEVSFNLEDIFGDPEGDIIFTAPTNHSVLDLEAPIEFKGTAANSISRINLRSPLNGTNYTLGETSIIEGKWSIPYKFSRGGSRKLIIDGFDGSNNRVATTTIEILLRSNFIPTPSDAFDGRGWIGMENTTKEFRDKVIKIAKRLKTRPIYLMAAMSFETGGTFSAKIRNRLSGATGLIQFLSSTARSLGTTTDELSQMTPIQQLDYVEKYMKPFLNRLNSLEDVYMSILFPVAVGKGRDFILFRKPSVAYQQNKGLDLNRDGTITVEEAAMLVRKQITS